MCLQGFWEVFVVPEQLVDHVNRGNWAFLLYSKPSPPPCLQEKRRKNNWGDVLLLIDLGLFLQNSFTLASVLFLLLAAAPFCAEAEMGQMGRVRPRSKWEETAGGRRPSFWSLLPVTCVLWSQTLMPLSLSCPFHKMRAVLLESAACGSC